MKQSASGLLILCIFLSFTAVMHVSPPAAVADPFADAVVSVSYGSGAGFGQDRFPDIVLGPPMGGGASAGSTDVLSLGDGGSITLAFTDNIVVNGEGPDFIVFENPFYVAGNPENVFCEVAFVEVSRDGIEFYRFPNDYNPEGEPINNPSNWSGFGGVFPVYSHPDNGIDPTDPAVAGGDAFDLDDVGLDWIRFVRIVDTGEPPNAATDDDGDEIYDPGHAGGENAGFDLDAVVAVYSRDELEPEPSPTPAPTPDEPSIDLKLNAVSFQPNDVLDLSADLFNPGPDTLHGWLFVLLDIGDIYLYWPGWRDEIDAEEMSLYPGGHTLNILRFTWPSISTPISGWTFRSAMVDDSGQLISNIDSETFRFDPEQHLTR